jgi:solute carrier family 13 (sodium-dependent dicarboxylate transporter), member 2/3/5
MALNARQIGLFPQGLTPTAWFVAALLALMAVWWATEAIPIAITSLLPLVALPLCGAATGKAVAASYADPIVLLLLGGFILAVGIERWGLHRRIALNMVSAVPGGSRALIAGFMIATAVISMWISNTATTLMMLPIALSAAAVVDDDAAPFASALLLGICYAASIGGVATPIGTPTNLIALDFIARETGATPRFVTWMQFGVPVMLGLLPVAWWIVTRKLAPSPGGASAHARVRTERAALGAMTASETRIALIFGCTAAAWIARGFVQDAAKSAGFEPVWLMGWSDTSIAFAGVIAMFLVPAGNGEKRALLSWDEAVRIPWGVILLFGGGIALGAAVEATGLADWLGTRLTSLAVLPGIIFLALLVALIVYLSEIMSNVAAMTTIGPILGGIATGLDFAPAALIATAAMAASCGFMLPAATGPNAVVYGTAKVPVGDMLRAGFLLDLAGIVIITSVGYWLLPLII